MFYSICLQTESDVIGQGVRGENKNKNKKISADIVALGHLLDL